MWRPQRLRTLPAVKLAPFVMALAPTTLAVSPAGAEPVSSPTHWRLDVSARGIGSVELAPSAEHMREGLVPALSVRALRRLGALQLGGTLGAGFPAWYGKAEASISLDLERVLASPRCELVRESADDLGRQECSGARWSLVSGFDTGVGLFYFDAPPETSPSSNALIYWGPLVRARLQLHVVDVLANARGVGLVVGANAGVTSARYTSTASGAGVRLEPELELGLTLRL